MRRPDDRHRASPPTPTASVYEGSFIDGQHDGTGQADERPQGYTYDGDWVAGVKEGKGKITYPDGAIYDGDLVKGQRAGTGTLTMPDGLIYVGDWADGQINGTGKLTQPNGDVYEGQLREGPARGQRQDAPTPTATSTRAASWPTSAQGKGIFTARRRLSSTTATGSRAGCEGTGVVTYPDGSVYVGAIQGRPADGQGKITYADGATYEGDWEAGVIEGEGTRDLRRRAGLRRRLQGGARPTGRAR